MILQPLGNCWYFTFWSAFLAAFVTCRLTMWLILGAWVRPASRLFVTGPLVFMTFHSFRFLCVPLPLNERSGLRIPPLFHPPVLFQPILSNFMKLTVDDPPPIPSVISNVQLIKFLKNKSCWLENWGRSFERKRVKAEGKKRVSPISTGQRPNPLQIHQIFVAFFFIPLFLLEVFTLFWPF